MKRVFNIILGTGIAGLSAGQHLKEQGQDYLIIEKEEYAGGLCASFDISDFIFDQFVHMSFTNNKLVRQYFDSTRYYTHTPNPYNYYYGTWLKHPAINNLFPLKTEEKALIIQGLNRREEYFRNKNDNYENWLRYQYGNIFLNIFRWFTIGSISVLKPMRWKQNGLRTDYISLQSGKFYSE